MLMLFSGADDAKCYKLIKESSDKVHIDDFFVKYCDALTECTLQGGFLARPRTVPQLVSLVHVMQRLLFDHQNCSDLITYKISTI